MKNWWLLLCILAPLAVAADPSGIVRLQTALQADTVYERVYKALETGRFWVVNETNLGERMASHAGEWGANFNRSRLSAVRVLAFGSIEWANALANEDPDLLALYPLHLTVYERGGTTYVVWPRLASLARDTRGEARVDELDAEVRHLLERALKD